MKTALWQKVILVLGGVIGALLLLEGALRTAGYFFTLKQERANARYVQRSGTYTIMCLGESTTAYFLVKEPYPVKLERILNTSGLGMDFKVINRGMVAANTSDLMAQLKDDLDKYKPDMVVAMMGINDCGYSVKASERGALNQWRVINLVRFLVKVVEKKLMAEKERSIVKPVIQYAKSKHDDGDYQHPLLQEGRSNMDQGQYAQAEKIFIQAASVDKLSGAAFLSLGRLYFHWSKYALSEDMFRKGLSLRPQDAEGYFGLALVASELGKLDEAQAAFMRSRELDPYQSNTYLMSGYFYWHKRNDMSSAAEAFRNAIKVQTDNYMAYRELVKIYTIQKMYAEAEAVINEFKLKCPANDRIYQDIIQYYESRSEEGGLFHQRAGQARVACFEAVTAKNYRLLKKQLDARGIKLVCMQYPLRALSALKDVFKEERGVVFVDNEMPFRKALAKASYGDLFIDQMFGDFGHCSERGNELIARNASQVIIDALSVVQGERER